MKIFESIIVSGFISILLNVVFGLPHRTGVIEPSMRIVNGARTKAGQYPHMAYIEIIYIIHHREIKVHCGGTLISPQYVLTAGHCVYNNIAMIQVHLGDLDVSHYQDGLRPQIFDVVDVIIHPNFNMFIIPKYDMALLKLNQSVVFNEFVDSACLPMTRRFDHIHSAVVTGWGSNHPTNLSASGDTHLNHVTVSIRNNTACWQKFKKSLLTITNSTSLLSKPNTIFGIYLDYYYGKNAQTICAGSDGKDSCIGDSGGPLQIQNNDTRRACKYEVIGVVSYGTDFCTGYGRYENVGAHIDWIADVIGVSKETFQRK